MGYIKRRRGAGSRMCHFFAANMGTYFFTLQAVEKAARKQLDGCWHAMDAAVPSYSIKKGRIVTPSLDEHNAIRVETLVFDMFQSFKGLAGLLVNRDEEFACVKSPTDAILAVA